jgi:hypothetical protein
MRRTTKTLWQTRTLACFVTIMISCSLGVMAQTKARSAHSPPPATFAGKFKPLEVPSNGPDAQAPWQATHVVKEGETLWDLSRQYRGNPVLWREIGDPNGVVVPKRMQPGTVLLLGKDVVSRYAGRVVALTGDVRISNVRATGTGKLVNDAPLQLGIPIPLGAQLRTGPESFVTLVLTDAPMPAGDLLSPEQLMNKGRPRSGTLVTLPSQSLVQISSIRDANGKASVVLDLIAGQIDSHAKQASDLPSGTPSWLEPFSQQIRTRVASVGVRGTYFRVSLPEGSDTMTTSVLEGSVVAQREGQKDLVQLGHAQGAVIDSKGIFSQPLLPAPQWQNGIEVQNFPEVDLAWQAVPGAQRYRVQLAKDAGFLNILAQREVALNPALPQMVFHASLGDLPKGRYYARVTAFTKEQLEGLFAVTPIQRGAFKIDDQGAIQQGYKSIELNWTDLPNAKYSVEVTTDQGSGAPEGSAEPVIRAALLSSNRIRISALAPGAYRWQVKGEMQRNGQRLIVTSPWQKFTVSGAR